MELTASRQHFEASRATTFSDFQTTGIWATRVRAVLAALSNRAVADEYRDTTRAALGAIDGFLDSWRPLDSEYGQAAMHRLHKVYDACDAMAWRVRDAGSVAFWQVYDRCDPVISQLYDRCAPALERTGNGVRAVAEQASARRGVTLAAVVVGLPAVAFAFFAAAHWVTDDDPRAVAGLTEDAGAPTLNDPPVQLSTTLVEPPASGRAVSADLPQTDAIVLAMAEGPSVNVEPAIAGNGEPGDRAALDDGFHSAQLEPAGEEPSGGDGGTAISEVLQPVAVADTEQVAALTVSAGHPAASFESSTQAHDDLYPFKPKPRPWGSKRADTQVASALPLAVAVPRPDRSARTAGPSTTGYRIQLAAVRDRAQAVRLWESLNRTDSDLLGALQPDISDRTMGNNARVHRLQAGPLTSRSDAEALCSALEKRRVDCLVVKADG